MEILILAKKKQQHYVPNYVCSWLFYVFFQSTRESKNHGYVNVLFTKG